MPENKKPNPRYFFNDSVWRMSQDRIPHFDVEQSSITSLLWSYRDSGRTILNLESLEKLFKDKTRIPYLGITVKPGEQASVDLVARTAHVLWMNDANKLWSIVVGWLEHREIRVRASAVSLFRLGLEESSIAIEDAIDKIVELIGGESEDAGRELALAIPTKALIDGANQMSPRRESRDGFDEPNKALPNLIDCVFDKSPFDAIKILMAWAEQGKEFGSVISDSLAQITLSPELPRDLLMKIQQSLTKLGAVAPQARGEVRRLKTRINDMRSKDDEIVKRRATKKEISPTSNQSGSGKTKSKRRKT